MIDIRRILIVLAVAVLYSVLIFATVDAFYPSPEYEEFCQDRHAKPYPLERPENCTPLAQIEIDGCYDIKGTPVYSYDEYNCATSFECSMCNNEYQSAREKHNFWQFIIAAIFGLIGIVVGLNLPLKKNTVHEWVGSGFMLGGIFAIFFATASYYGDLHRFVRPLVILIELILVIYLAYKKLGKK